MVADECYGGKSWVDLSDEELLQGLKRFAGVDMQQMSDESFCRRVFRVMKMDARVPVDSNVFMPKCALRKYLADSGLTEVVRRNARQFTLKHGKVLVETIPAGIEPLEFHRMVVKQMHFDLVTHDPDALFNKIAKQQRHQDVIEANDAVRQQTGKRRDARSVAVEGTKPHGSTAGGHDSRGSANAAGLKAERNRQYDNNECFVCGKQGHKQWDCPESPQGKAGGGVHGQGHGQTPIQRQQSTNDPAQHTRSKTTRMAPATTPRARGYQAASKAVVTKTELAALESSTQNDNDYMYIRVPRGNILPVDNRLTEMVQHSTTFSKAPVDITQHQLFTPSRYRGHIAKSTMNSAMPKS